MYFRASLLLERLDPGVAMIDCLYPVVQSAVMDDVIQSALAHTSLKHAGIHELGLIPPDNRPKAVHARSNPRNAGTKHIFAGAPA